MTTNCLVGAFDSPAIHVMKAIETIPGDIEYDTLIGCGMSGALVVPMLAFGLQIPNYAIIRKPGDLHKHGVTKIEGNVGRKGWLFVDDGIETGKTFRHVTQQMEMVNSCPFKGAYFYGHLFDRGLTFMHDPLRVLSRI